MYFFASFGLMCAGTGSAVFAGSLLARAAAPAPPATAPAAAAGRALLLSADVLSLPTDVGERAEPLAVASRAVRVLPGAAPSPTAGDVGAVPARAMLGEAAEAPSVMGDATVLLPDAGPVVVVLRA